MVWDTCVQSYPKEKMSAEDQVRLKQIEENQRLLMQRQQSEQDRKTIEEMQREIEQLKKQ